jgi:heme exporter protein C
MTERERHQQPGIDPLGVVAAITAILVLGALGVIFLYAPQERTMGIVQKIFYIHVPSAIAAYIGFFIAFGGSIGYLFTRNRKADIWARAGAEVGVVFCAIVLITGPLWARKAWGTFWTGEPRLMLTLVLFLTFCAYLVVYSLGNKGEMTRRICALLAILGVVNIPLVRWSVARWRGHHPRVITGEGGGLAPGMETALIAGFVAIAAIFLTVMWLRVRAGLAALAVEQQRHRLEKLRVRIDRTLRKEEAQ